MNLKLVLFDIDGTILLTRGSGRRSLEAALERVLGQSIRTEGIAFAGRTDRQILRDILGAAGIDLTRANGILGEIEVAYQEEMRRLLAPEDVSVLPGVRSLVESLAREPDVHLALVTGNLEPMAYLKLEAVRLAHYFPFGAFGSDAEDRNELPAIALARAQAHTGHRFESSSVFIIGDTVHDVQCSRSIGCRTVIVCTGTYSRQELAPHAPDLLLDDLSDHAVVVNFIRR